MGFEYVQKIPSKEEVIEQLPLSNDLKNIKQKRDTELKNIIEDKSNKFLLIIGPCSADDEDAVCDYVSRLAKIAEKVSDKLYIIPRIYTNKPRTTGAGYKGMLHQPNPEKAPNMYDGIMSIRKMHIRAIRESHLTAADEMLYPENLIFVEDMLSYIAIGARSVENQQHRLVTSGINIPVGMKNPTSGDLSVMLNSIIAAQNKHTFIYQGYEVQTTGNPLAHAILRGSINKHGQSIPNYHYEDLNLLADRYKEKELQNPLIIIDVNHSNSNKHYYEQPRIIKEVLNSRKYSPTLNNIVRGVMVESYIEPGNQKINQHIYGKSITDACLGWNETEELIYYMADKI